jgi:hypothetical protein
VCDCYERNLRQSLVDVSFTQKINCEICRKKLEEARLERKRIILFKRLKRVKACYSASRLKCFGCERGIKSYFLTFHNSLTMEG